MITSGTIQNGEIHDFWGGLAAVRAALNVAGTCAIPDPEGDGHALLVDGHYGPCQGLAVDGRLVGSTTYYLGVRWDVLGTVGNEVQSDSFLANVSFDTYQHRNVPTPAVVFPTPTP